jgi:aerotaxis receptor
MRVNEPITDHEVEVPEGEPLVSRTDRGGIIVFANHVFVEMSGFAEQELIGSPHNIVRHPLMPQEAFANLWATIKAGRPWDGLVKNRAKTGDFYWVRANVTPVIESGEVTGYISIRSKPTRAQIAGAERAYADIRSGKAKGIALADGEVVRRILAEARTC